MLSIVYSNAGRDTKQAIYTAHLLFVGEKMKDALFRSTRLHHTTPCHIETPHVVGGQ